MSVGWQKQNCGNPRRGKWWRDEKPGHPQAWPVLEVLHSRSHLDIALGTASARVGSREPTSQTVIVKGVRTLQAHEGFPSQKGLKAAAVAVKARAEVHCQPGRPEAWSGISASVESVWRR